VGALGGQPERVEHAVVVRQPQHEVPAVPPAQPGVRQRLGGSEAGEPRDDGRSVVRPALEHAVGADQAGQVPGAAADQQVGAPGAVVDVRQPAADDDRHAVPHRLQAGRLLFGDRPVAEPAQVDRLGDLGQHRRREAAMVDAPLRRRRRRGLLQAGGEGVARLHRAGAGSGGVQKHQA